MHSVRAQKDFATLPPTGRYCVGLGRYAQSPIHEFCALGTDITAITFEPEAQKLVSRLFEEEFVEGVRRVSFLTLVFPSSFLPQVPREKLLMALERALVNVVNDVGVLINDVVSDTYMQYVLPFISGFGPRKAAQLIKDIVKSVSLSRSNSFSSLLDTDASFSLSLVFSGRSPHEPTGAHESQTP